MKFSALHWTCSKNLDSCLDCALRFLTNFFKMFLCMFSLTWIIAAKVKVISPNYLSISLCRFDRFKRNLNKETVYRWKKHVFFRLKFICKWSIIFLLFFSLCTPLDLWHSPSHIYLHFKFNLVRMLSFVKIFILQRFWFLEFSLYIILNRAWVWYSPNDQQPPMWFSTQTYVQGQW